MPDFSLRDLLQKLAEERNLDFRGYKPSSLERRVRHRLSQLKISSYADYLSLINKHPDETNNLLNTVLVNVTEFFRDPPLWRVLESDILPQLRDSAPPNSIFRVWSCACASGEEAYSLAILINEVFGERLKDLSLKVYGTDADEQALTVARKGEYPADALKNVRPEWREKYFSGKRLFRVNRDIRHLCIFGRNNMTADAPISHLRLLMCRNALIYFGLTLQRQVLARFHYALEPGGVLVLGKSESLLAQSKMFRSIDTKWRIFRRVDSPGEPVSDLFRKKQEATTMGSPSRDYELLKLYHDSLLQVLEPGILLLDQAQVVISENEAVLRHLRIQDQKLIGQPLASGALATCCPELLALIQKQLGRSEQTASRFEYTHSFSGEDPVAIAVTVKPIVTAKGGRVGTLIYVEDVSPRHRLQTTVEELQTTGEELQSTNEELETSNEELQSTNEELETTNEELQSTNEELETTNEELQALNEELGTTNEELEVRTRELDAVNRRYMETLEKVPWPVMLVNNDGRIEIWNSAAEGLFGLASRSIVGLEVRQLPVPEKLRRLLAQQVRSVAARRKPRTTVNFYLASNSYTGPLDIRCTPLSDESYKGSGVLVVFESHKGGKTEAQTTRRRGELVRRAAVGKRPKAAKKASKKSSSRKR